MTNNLNDIKHKVDLWCECLIVIVLYETNLVESITFQSLKKSIHQYSYRKKISILLYDNSLIGQKNIEENNKENFFSITYVHNPANPGVSWPYNRAAELAKNLNKKWLLVLDHDTQLPENTIHKYEEALVCFPDFPIYAPQLYYGKILLSPCRYWFRKGSNLVNIKPGVHLMENRNVLNSGLLIDLIAFHRVGGYDETVPLYFSDFVFFDRLKNHFREFVVIDCKFEHELSSVDYSNKLLALTRFTYYCKGARAASKSNSSLIAHIEYSVTVGLRSILMSLRFNNLSFLKVFLTQFISK